MGLSYADIEKLNNIVKEKVKEPNLGHYDLKDSFGGGFDELYYNDLKFTQVVLCDYDQDTEKRLVVKGFEAYEEIKQAFKAYDEKRKKVRKEIAEDHFEYDFQVDDYLALSRLRNFGKGVRLFKRFKPEEEAREEDRARHHEMMMEIDEDYRKHHEWMQEEDRPFGGAFVSWEDYYQYRGAI